MKSKDWKNRCIAFALIFVMAVVLAMPDGLLEKLHTRVVYYKEYENKQSVAEDVLSSIWGQEPYKSARSISEAAVTLNNGNTTTYEVIKEVVRGKSITVTKYCTVRDADGIQIDAGRWLSTEVYKFNEDGSVSYIRRNQDNSESFDTLTQYTDNGMFSKLNLNEFFTDYVETSTGYKGTWDIEAYLNDLGISTVSDIVSGSKLENSELELDMDTMTIKSLKYCGGVHTLNTDEYVRNISLRYDLDSIVY